MKSYELIFLLKMGSGENVEAIIGTPSYTIKLIYRSVLFLGEMYESKYRIHYV